MPKYTQPRKTWSYTQDFKIKAVKFSHRTDLQVQEVAAALDIHPFILSRWRKEYREGKQQGDNQRRVGMTKQKRTPSVQQMSELQKLRKENGRLKKENDLLIKWQRFFAERHQSDRFIEKYGKRFGVSYLCRWLEVSRIKKRPETGAFLLSGRTLNSRRFPRPGLPPAGRRWNVSRLPGCLPPAGPPARTAPVRRLAGRRAPVAAAGLPAGTGVRSGQTRRCAGPAARCA